MRELLEGDRRKEILEYLSERYGIEEAIFDSYSFLRASKCVWLVPTQLYDLVGDMKVDKIGMRFLSGRDFPYKPTYLFAREFGHLAKRRVVDINEEELGKFFQREEFQLNTELDGYHLVSHKSCFVGTALIRDGKFESQLPKSLIGQYL